VHFAAVHETAASFYQPEVLDSWSKQPDEARYQYVRAAIASDEEIILVAQDASGVVGFGSIVPSLRELRAVYVHPKVGRRGIGSQILAQLERLALDRGLLELQMNASTNAEAFYNHAGYESVERGAHRLRNGREMACIRMKKELTPLPDGSSVEGVK